MCSTWQSVTFSCYFNSKELTNSHVATIKTLCFPVILLPAAARGRQLTVGECDDETEDGNFKDARELSLEFRSIMEAGSLFHKPIKAVVISHLVEPEMYNTKSSK